MDPIRLKKDSHVSGVCPASHPTSSRHSYSPHSSRSHSAERGRATQTREHQRRNS
jgi:hypothetical protein